MKKYGKYEVQRILLFSLAYIILYCIPVYPINGLRISLASVPIYLSSIKYGDRISCMVALLGGFFVQAPIYGITIISILNVGILIFTTFVFSKLYNRFGEGKLYIICVAVEIMTILLTFLVDFVVSFIYGNSSPYFAYTININALSNKLVCGVIYSIISAFLVKFCKREIYGG